MRQAQRDAGHRPGLTTSERERLKEFEREVRELKRRWTRRDLASLLVFHRGDIPIRRGRTTWRKLSSASIDGRLCLGLRFQLRVMFR